MWESNTWIKAAVTMLTAVGAAGIGFTVPNLSDKYDHLEAQIQTRLPDLRDYSFVALPVEQPPDNAYIETSHYADSLHSGQVVMFQYKPFTLYACSEVPGYTSDGTCRSQDKTLLRTIHLDGVVTRYSIGTKSLDDPRRVAPDLFETVSDYVEEAKFTTTPPWLRPYAETQLRRRY